jgi:uncharacterized phiE125 gp8 family phage protein
MSWKVTEAPSAFPVTLAQAKAVLRVQHTAEDALIQQIIESAYDYCEQELDLAIMEQEITYKLDAFPEARTITLPRANLLSITSFTYTDTALAEQSFTDYVADSFSTPARVVNNTDTWPETADRANTITIVYRAGFSETETGDSHTTPKAVIQAMTMLITHFYENRNTVAVGPGMASAEIALATANLLHKYRRLGV